MPSDFLIFMSTALDFPEGPRDAFSCSETWMHLLLFGDYPHRLQNVWELATQYAKADGLLLVGAGSFQLQLCL